MGGIQGVITLECVQCRLASRTLTQRAARLKAPPCRLSAAWVDSRSRHDGDTLTVPSRWRASATAELSERWEETSTGWPLLYPITGRLHIFISFSCCFSSLKCPVELLAAPQRRHVREIRPTRRTNEEPADVRY